MELRRGFIHEKLEIKILILFVLERLPSPVPLSDLTEIVMCDDGITYFDFIESLSELVKTEHITQLGGTYVITEKGKRNGSVTESSLPYSVRLKAERSAMRLSRSMKRSDMIKTDCVQLGDGSFSLKLVLSDGIGDMFSLDLLCGSEEMSRLIEKRFQKNAEQIYSDIMELLLGTI